MHSAVSSLAEDVKKATIAGVLFGSTKNKQEGGKIKNYPKDQVMTYCTEDDGVCWGRLDVTGGKIVEPNPFTMRKVES
jgi:cutinase